MKLLLAIIALAGGSIVPAAAQTFDAISVKPHEAGDNRRSLPQFLPGGRFISVGIPLRFVIAVAYDVGFQSIRLSGGPDWVRSPEGAYDIEATAPEGAISPGLPANVRHEKMKLMLQALLAERFQLKIRRETKEMPVYALVVGKGSPKLEKAKIEEKDCASQDGAVLPCHALGGGRGRGLHGDAVSIADVVSFVENWTDRPLVDKTGIQGLFRVQTSGWQPMQPGPPPPAGAKAEDGGDLADVPTLFTVFERLGLKLEALKLPVEIFVIERVEKATGN